jgi:hypothetical protein
MLKTATGCGATGMMILINMVSISGSGAELIL